MFSPLVFQYFCIFVRMKMVILTGLGAILVSPSLHRRPRNNRPPFHSILFSHSLSHLNLTQLHSTQLNSLFDPPRPPILSLLGTQIDPSRHQVASRQLIPGKGCGPGFSFCAAPFLPGLVFSWGGGFPLDKNSGAHTVSRENKSKMIKHRCSKKRPFTN